MTSDTTVFAELGTWMLLDILWALTNIIFALVFMFMLDPGLSLIVLAVIPALVILAVAFKRLILKAYRKVQTSQSEATAILHETISGIRTIKGFLREKKHLADYTGKSGTIYSSGFRAAFLSSLLIPLIQFVSYLLISAILYSGNTGSVPADASGGTLTIGVVQAFISYIIFIMWPVQEIARVLSQMQRSIAGAERIFSFLEIQPDIIDSADAQHMNRFAGNIEFRNVDFHYDPGCPVLSGFSLKVDANQTIALVGPTGGGKTTIVNLLCRFLEPVKGMILVDDRDYTAYSLHSFQSRLGVVLQQSHLFRGSIRENIRYGKPGACDEDIYAAARLAHAHEFIARLPKQYDEDVGENGDHLSPGQQQLVSLSRAILSDPDFLIMDEATSSVDLLTEELIRKAMEEFRKRCTCFIIAHRLTTIKHADRILVIEKGKIAEDGNHRELIIRQGKYYQLYADQFRTERERPE